MSEITKGERVELKSVVRNQFKVLRAELEQREAELHAEIEDQIVAKYRETDLAWEATQHLIHEATMEANRKINDLLTEAGYQIRGGTERMWLHTPTPTRSEESRMELRRHANAQIAARVKAARLRLDREEADLLRTLAVGALESDEAHRFVGTIPTVGELVPNARLAELEATLDSNEVDD